MSTAGAESHLRENPFELAQLQLRNVGEAFGIDPNLIGVLGKCKKTVEVSIPVSMDDGSIGVFEGYRVTHNATRGPSKGGILYLLDKTTLAPRQGRTRSWPRPARFQVLLPPTGRRASLSGASSL